MTNQEILTAAKLKTNVLVHDNCQIRLTADEKSYWVFRFGGAYYIGILASEKTNPHFPFLKNREVKELVRADGSLIAKLQYLIPVPKY